MLKNPTSIIISLLVIFTIGCHPKPMDTEGRQRIQITVEIPKPPDEMPLYKLTASFAPVDFLNEKLEKLKLPTLQLDKLNQVLRSGVANEEDFNAFVDMRNGDTEFIPNLARVVETAGKVKPIDSISALRLARAVFTDERFIAKDATTLRLADPIRITGSADGRPGAGNPGDKMRKQPMQMMTMVTGLRYAGDYKVYGLGSHTVVTLGNDGSVIGIMRRWRTATIAEKVKPSISEMQVREEILRQLLPMTTPKGTKITVDKVEIAYYDNNKALLQPVYHFEATVQPENRRVSPIRVSGFLPMVEPREPIPDLRKKVDGANPEKIKVTDSKLSPKGIRNFSAQGGITLGEYCNRNWPNDNAYITMSYSFLNGLNFMNSIIGGLTPSVTRTQWYEAWPWEIVGPSSRNYMNAVNVAYTVPHGDWLINSTQSNCCDIWSVPDIGTGSNPGFGAAAGGSLATWVIMSCEVIPSFYDRANEIGGSNNGFDAFNPWWGVFQGMHNAIGFRTIMFYPDDNTNWAFGFAASLGGDVNAAWFQEVAAYHAGDGTYASQHLNGNIQVHYDRASTIIDGRDLGQSIFSVGAQSASGTLWNFWMNN